MKVFSITSNKCVCRRTSWPVTANLHVSDDDGNLDVYITQFSHHSLTHVIHQSTPTQSTSRIDASPYAGIIAQHHNEYRMRFSKNRGSWSEATRT